MVVVGLLLGIVGADVSSGIMRFCFGIFELSDGIAVVIIAVGVFAVSEIVSNLGEPEGHEVFTSKVKNLFPTKEDLKQSFGATVRGTALGAFFVVFYTWPLKYGGLGELAVLVVWGPLMIGGGYYAITGAWNPYVVLASLPYALSTTAIIFGKPEIMMINNSKKLDPRRFDNEGFTKQKETVSF